jgi:transcriptional regulator with XRE-family HTH domain
MAMAQPPWKALREASGLSQREVERRLGWTTGTLYWIEKGASRPDKEAQLRQLYASVLAAGLHTTQEAQG